MLRAPFSQSHVEFVRQVFGQFREPPCVQIDPEDDEVLLIGHMSIRAMPCDYRREGEDGEDVVVVYHVDIARRQNEAFVPDWVETELVGVEASFAEAVVLAVSTWAGEGVEAALSFLGWPDSQA